MNVRRQIEIINKRNQSQNPKNGSTRIKNNDDGVRFIEAFQNGSWRFLRNYQLNLHGEERIRIIIFPSQFQGRLDSTEV